MRTPEAITADFDAYMTPSPKLTPQAASLLAYLTLHPYGITPRRALFRLGIYRLSARILELRVRGYAIDTIMEAEAGRRFARYVLRQGRSHG